MWVYALRKSRTRKISVSTVLISIRLMAVEIKCDPPYATCLNRLLHNGRGEKNIQTPVAVTIFPQYIQIIKFHNIFFPDLQRLSHKVLTNLACPLQLRNSKQQFSKFGRNLRVVSKCVILQGLQSLFLRCTHLLCFSQVTCICKSNNFV
jgi:hypothetical protein